MLPCFYFLNAPTCSDTPSSPVPRPCRSPQSPACPITHQLLLTRVISREAAAALMCRLGCRMELLQSRALAKVPTALGEKLKVRKARGKRKWAEGISQMRKKENTHANNKKIMPTSKNRTQNYVHTSPSPSSPTTHPSPGHHEKLINLPVCERVVWIPDFHLHLLLVPVIRFSWGDGIMGRGKGEEQVS